MTGSHTGYSMQARGWHTPAGLQHKHWKIVRTCMVGDQAAHVPTL